MSEEYYIDETIPKRIKKFFATFLVHSKGTLAGQPFHLLDWQYDIIKDLYGTYKKSDNLRRYRQGLILVPRKNGKSTLSGGLCLYELLFGEASGEIIIVANARDQARIIFQIVADFVANNKQLQKSIKVYKNAIYNPKNRSILKVLSREANTALGLNCSMVIFDELLGAPDDALYNSLSTSMGARKQPLMLSISTAGFSKASFLYQLVEHAERVNHGIINDDTFYGKIYGLKEGQDWSKEETWKACNPSLGHTISIDFFRTEYNRAKEFTRFQNSFCVLYLNAWIDLSKSWINDSQWMECGQDIKLEDFKGEPCYAGLDLSSTTDLTSLSLCFYKNEKYNIFTFPFCPSDGMLLRSRRDKVPYEQWAREKHMFTTPGNATDYDFVIHKIKELGEMFEIKAVCVDRWNSTFLNTKLMELGLNVVGFGQGFGSMASAVRGMERLVLNKGLVHDKHPVLRWCVSNVLLKVDAAGNSKCDKAKSKDRIDCVISTLMALEECSKNNFNTGVAEVSWI